MISRNSKIFLIYSGLFFAIFSDFSCAKELSATQKPPLVIHVLEKIVYNKKLNLCTAYGNVRARKDQLSITGDQVRIYFQKTPQNQTSSLENEKIKILPSHASQNKKNQGLLPFSKGKIKKICIIGNASIQMNNTLLKAPSINYDVETEKLEALGPEIKLTHPQTHVLAKDSLIYDQKTNKATAYGHVWIYHQDTPQKSQSVLYADQAQAEFIKVPQPDPKKQKLSLKEVRAYGNVSFQQDQVVARSNTARYDAIQEKAWFEGDVKIKEGQHFAHSDKAEIDLQKKVYTLRSRSECIFYPEKKEKK